MISFIINVSWNICKAFQKCWLAAAFEKFKYLHLNLERKIEDDAAA